VFGSSYNLFEGIIQIFSWWYWGKTPGTSVGFASALAKILNVTHI
jgi:hypothetical protein